MPRDYEEWCDWNDADAPEGYYHPDRLHKDGGFVYFKDAFGPDMDSVVVSSEMCAAEQAEIHSSELPNLCNDSGVSGPQNVSVQFRVEVDELNLQCIDVGNTRRTSLEMDDPGPGLPVILLVPGILSGGPAVH